MRGAQPQTRIDLFDSLGILCFHEGGCPFPLLSEKFWEVFWKLLRAVRLKWSTSSPAEGRGCQGLCKASWREMVWMCVIKPTMSCLSALEVKVVKQLFFF